LKKHSRTNSSTSHGDFIGAVDDYLAAVTMISTSTPGKTSCGDTTHARTGALSGSSGGA
jgi:hypothetical protein